MKCPKCGLEYETSVNKCQCGHVFVKHTPWAMVILLGVISGIVCGIAVNLSHAKNNTLLYLWALGNVAVVNFMKPLRRLGLYALLALAVGILTSIIHSKL